jgi:hypothetical protein
MVAIPLTSGDIRNIQGRVINPAFTPREFHVDKRSLPPKGSQDTAQVSNLLPKPEAINLHPEIPMVDPSSQPVKQTNSSFSTLYVLLENIPGARTLVAAAAKEQKMIGGTIGA